ncbi:hypothetical protein IDG74_10110 [Escherichia coli]|uniref:hypothetical protein n=1 Tax=Escherichia coli TaxID=562 RepID=UPI0008FBDB1A|nr:hypothetical protein [Escherichia coli]AXV13522.1 hypothetical protein CHI19_24200 [Escherichia coli]EEV7801391.1 hypothetical protein [Escherichia coli]EEY4999779.1 hypothetical protein [Escherichia coli]EFA4517963.1 hypothetical protein [Escherichia coli]EFA6850715.1 hypothetical protein [Escherichia coli]
MKKTLCLLSIALYLNSGQTYAGFSSYPGYTSGEIGAAIGCAINAWLGIPACGHANGSEYDRPSPDKPNLSEPFIPRPTYDASLHSWHGGY